MDDVATKKPDDYILATNQGHSVKELVETACSIAGIPESKIISSKNNFRPSDVNMLQGDFSKARKKLGWKPKTKFRKSVKLMVETDIERWQRWLNGERFPWDVNPFKKE